MDEDSESFQITQKRVGAEPSISIPADSSTLVLSLLSLIDLVMVPQVYSSAILPFSHLYGTVTVCP